MEKYLQSKFEKIIKEKITPDIADRVVTDFSNLCNRVVAVQDNTLHFDGGLGGGTQYVWFTSQEWDCILPNLWQFPHLKSIIVKPGIQSDFRRLFINRWSRSLERIAIHGGFDIRPLNDFPNLRELGVFHHDADLAAIAPLAEQLTSLSFNSAKDEACIADFRNLRMLTYGKQEGRLPFDDMPALERLFIEDYHPFDLAGIEGCCNLQRLRIQTHSAKGCSAYTLCDISALAGLKNLRGVTFVSSGVEDISPLAGLPLEELEIPCCSVLDFSPISEMKGLRTLDLDSCLLENIDFLEGHQNLEEISLGNVQLDDWDILLTLPKLKTVNVYWHTEQERFSDELLKKLGKERKKVERQEFDFSDLKINNGAFQLPEMS